MGQLPFRLAITDHAVDRYVERVKPALGREEARAEMRRLFAHCREVPKPAWVYDGQGYESRYVEPCEGIVFAAEPSGTGPEWVVTTVLIRGVDHERRRRKAEQRRLRGLTARRQRVRGRPPAEEAA